MTEKDLNLLIARRIQHYLDAQSKTQADLADYMGVSQATVSNWCTGRKVPRMDKIDKICEFFGVERSDLMVEDKEPAQGYYLDPEAAEIAQEVYERPELKVLFDASRKVSAEDIQFVVEMIDRMAKKERGE